MRDDRAWTMPQLASKMENRLEERVHPTAISKIEKGNRGVDVSEAVALAEIFGMSVDALLGRPANSGRDKSLAFDELLRTVGHALGTVNTASDSISARARLLGEFRLTKAEEQALFAAQSAANDLTFAVSSLITATNRLAKFSSTHASAKRREELRVKTSEEMHREAAK